jgi:hypothetical protein
MDVSPVIRPTVADLASFQSYVAVAFAFALEYRGLLSRFDLADELEAIAGGVAESPVRDLANILIAGLRAEADPAAPELQVIHGGKP